MTSVIQFSSESESPSCCCRLGRLRFPRRQSNSDETVVFVNTLAADYSDDDDDYSDDGNEMKALIGNQATSRVARWCTSLDSVLTDPLGLQSFTQFLKMEHSDENILFWKEVEEFKKITDHSDMTATAERVYSRYIKPSARQQINVDSWVVKDIEEHLSSPSTQIFEKAQKEIYQLMKMDCYFRFVRSQLVKDCLSAEMAGQPLPLHTPVIS